MKDREKATTHLYRLTAHLENVRLRDLTDDELQELWDALDAAQVDIENEWVRRDE